MKIVSYNVNGIRAAHRKGLLDWVEEVNPDILCIQETKAQDDQIPIEDFRKIGYKTYSFSAKKKGYSGVAIITKREPDFIKQGIGVEEYDLECRLIRADFGDLTVVNSYFPNGSTSDLRHNFKMFWLELFKKYVDDLKKKRPNLVLCGDYNICHKEIDIYDPIGHKDVSGFLPEEREWMDKLIESGFMDSFRYFYKTPNHYTWWSYRANARKRNLGWRIDYIIVNEELEERLLFAANLASVAHSDHCPMILVIDF